MKMTAILLLMILQSPETRAVSDLFDALDSNGDGKVVAGEISEAQRSYFQRALRVSDQNEDGALTRDELAIALTDPKPVDVATSGRRGSYDPKVFDRNQDGFVTKSEIPTPLQERFKRLFEQYGDSISLKVLQDLRDGQRSSPRSEKAMDDSMKMSDRMQEMRMSDQPNRMVELMKRFDTNRDGSLSARELRSAPAPVKALDRNKDGEISKTELSRLSGSPEIRSGNPRGGTGTQRPMSASAEAIFERLDKNRDGQLTGEEIPQRMRQVVRRVDRNSDKAISPEEFRRALEEQNRKR